MHELVVGGSQFVIATHSAIIMAYPDVDGLLHERRRPFDRHGARARASRARPGSQPPLLYAFGAVDVSSAGTGARDAGAGAGV